jgi:sodium transport system permease protein
MSAWRVVFAKEIRETLRDRRTLLMMIVVPVLLYPVLLIVMEQLLLFGIRNLESEAAPIAVVGDMPPALTELLDTEDGLRLVPIGDDPEAAIRSDSVTAVALIGAGVEGDATRPVTILFDAASDRSNRGRAQLSAVMSSWRDTLLASRLDDRGLSRSFAAPVLVADSSIALPEEVGGYALGRILPMLLVVITLLGAFYPAIDLSAGEKERGTLETLLTAPVPARDIVIGKFLAVALIGVTAAALNLGSMLLTFQTGILQVTEVLGLEVSIPFTSVLVIFLTLIPLAVLFGSVFLGIAVGSSSFKEAQNALTPVYMLVIIPAMLPIVPGIDFGPIWAVTPVAGVSFLFRDLMTGDAAPGLGVLVVLSTTVYALGALAFASRAFGSERVLFGSGEASAEVSRASLGDRWRSRHDRGVVPDPQVALLFVGLVAVLFFWVGIQLQIAFGERGALAAEWLLLFLPAVIAVWVGGFDPVRTLSLRRPDGIGVVGAVVLMAGAMPLVWLIGWIQTFVLPVPWEMLEGLEELVRADSVGRLVWLLLLIAVTPAIAEEVVFRGFLLGGTRSLKPWKMILLNGVVFGVFHLSFETVIRFLPTATLGVIIAWAVWRTGSIWVGALMHLLNNGTIVILASAPIVRDIFSDPEAPPPLWLVPVGVVLFSAGVRILLRHQSPVNAVASVAPARDSIASTLNQHP